MRKTQKSILSYKYQNTLQYKIQTTLNGPTKVDFFNTVGQNSALATMFIIYDGDDPVTVGAYTSNDNYPDSIDNHGSDGGNFLFCDGSVQAGGPQLAFSLPATQGVVLLNPKP